MASSMRLLVAIANHGTRNRHYLDQLLAAYRQMPISVSIVVLSNVPKDLGPDVEVLIGAPSPNPWSLPFAHRPIFRDRLEDYDLFIYSEDDTLVQWHNVKAFVDGLGLLAKNETPGYLRTEKAPDGSLSYSTCHSFFRWIPSSVKRSGGLLWAKYSNEHAAFYIATRAQLKAAFASGGFPIAPHEGRFDMLCSAATDLYTTGGFNRLVCIDRIPDFSLPHLPNKYIGKMGLPENELAWQLDALRRIEAGELPKSELLYPETKLPGCFGSKFYREKVDRTWFELLGRKPKRILVWGAGDGFFESSLKAEGHHVSVFPLDAVMGESCRQRGLDVLPVNGSFVPKGGGDFDAVLFSDVLHLVEDPGAILAALRPLLNHEGLLVARIPNLNEIRVRRRRMVDARFKKQWTRAAIGAAPLTARDLRSLAKKAGFVGPEIVAKPTGRLEKVNRMSLGLFSNMLSPHLYLRAKAPR